MPDRLRWAIVVTVTLVWVTSVIAGIAIDDYEPGGEIHGIFMGIVGTALAIGGKKDSGG